MNITSPTIICGVILGGRTKPTTRQWKVPKRKYADLITIYGDRENDFFQTPHRISRNIMKKKQNIRT